MGITILILRLGDKVFPSEISGSHGGDYEVDCLLGCCTVVEVYRRLEVLAASIIRAIRGEHNPQQARLTTSGWLQPANDAFYLIGSAVFKCMEYH
jgi:hypothetical protein